MAPFPSSKGYAELYLSYSDDAPVFEEMVGNIDKPINTINTCTVSPMVVALKIIPSKVLKYHNQITQQHPN